MPESIPEILSLALDFYRAPSRYAELRNHRVPLPAGVSELLSAHGNALSEERIADTAERLSSSPEELQSAQLFFIKQALLEAGHDHYRILGAERDDELGKIRQHYHHLIRLFHPDRDVNSEGWDNLYAPAINEAWNTLRNSERRKAYDATLHEPDALDAVMASAPVVPASNGTAASRPAPAGSWRDRISSFFLLTPGRAVLLLVIGALLLLWLLPNWGPKDNSLRIGQAEGKAVATNTAGTATSPADDKNAADESQQQASEAPPNPIGPRASNNYSPSTTPDQDIAVEDRIRQRLAAAERAVVAGRRAARERAQAQAQSVKEQTRVQQPAKPVAVDKQVTAAAKEQSSAIEQTISEAQQAAEQAPSLSSTGTAASSTAVNSASATSTDSRPVPPLDKAQIDELLKAFAVRYVAGDAVRFGLLFSEDADTTDAKGRQAIIALYEDFFARPESRFIRFNNLRIEYEGGWRSRVTARASVATRSLESGKQSEGKLLMNFLVEQTPDGPQIYGLDYR